MDIIASVNASRSKPGGTIGGLSKDARWEQKTTDPAHLHYIALTLTCTFEKVLSIIISFYFWASWSAHFVLWQTLSWSLQRLNQSQRGGTENQYWYFSYDDLYPMNIWIFNRKLGTLISFTMYLTSNNALRALKEILVCLRLQSLLERLNYSRKIRCYRDVGSTCHYLHGGQIALCEQSVQGLNHKILKTKIVAKQLSGCALVISKFGHLWCRETWPCSWSRQEHDSFSQTSTEGKCW